MDIENFEFVFDDNGTISTLSTDKLVLDDEDLETVILIKTKAFTQKLRIKGTADPRNKKPIYSFLISIKGKSTFHLLMKNSELFPVLIRFK